MRRWFGCETWLWGVLVAVSTGAGCTLADGLDTAPATSAPGHGLKPRDGLPTKEELLRDPLPARAMELPLRAHRDAGAPSSPTSPADAGVPGGGLSSPDAGIITDAGTVWDAGLLLDGGALVDGGGDVDAGLTDPEPPAGPIRLPTVASLRRISHVEYRHQLQDLFPEVELPELSLPRDLVSGYFANEQSSLHASPLLVDAYHRNAMAVAERVVPSTGFSPCGVDDACARTLIRDLGKRAFRRPLSQDDEDAFLTLFQSAYDSEENFHLALRLFVQSLLESPEFLYRTTLPTGRNAALGEVDPYELAERLSFLLWSAAPDEALYAAAASDTLHDDEVWAAQVDRMMLDPKFRRAMLVYFQQWLDLERIDHVAKAAEFAFGTSLQRDMAEETTRFLLDYLLLEERPIDDLISGRYTFLNAQLAGIYGVSPPPEGEWVRTELPEARTGFLTQPSFLASRGHPVDPSPVLRSILLLQRLLCIDLGRPPPGAEGATLPDGFVPQTNRERYEVLTAPPSCRSCHDIINPLGFGLEGFDTIGRIRNDEGGIPVDVSGSLLGTNFTGARELGDLLVAGDQIERCAVQNFVTYTLGERDQESHACLIHEVTRSLQQPEVSFQAMIRALAMHPSMRARLPGTVTP